ncbi:hypothetical protein [Vagococcus intermedius]|uniref:Uncharacterized protein n=1 Tax=Vagococcus intermedius TaxID=2991418 RepID=A0AAF0CTC5_9ENTE|nr:hypothetical protein [Vagococcus intermedius]WEG72491.1 hypothetical protein OL234_05750 [Vagococcus intermedius]WEG74578.1 hypothetical protein OL235_05755 [Vagococcus intermedius]
MKKTIFLKELKMTEHIQKNLTEEKITDLTIFTIDSDNIESYEKAKANISKQLSSLNAIQIISFYFGEEVIKAPKFLEFDRTYCYDVIEQTDQTILYDIYDDVQRLVQKALVRKMDNQLIKVDHLNRGKLIRTELLSKGILFKTIEENEDNYFQAGIPVLTHLKEANLFYDQVNNIVANLEVIQKNWLLNANFNVKETTDIPVVIL